MNLEKTETINNRKYNVYSYQVGNNRLFSYEILNTDTNEILKTAKDFINLQSALCCVYFELNIFHI